MGAMENKGLNIFNDKYILASPETATDADYAHIEGIIAHEYFHNWTGNRVTCRDWFQLCLKEGLTVFRDQQFTADQRSAAVKRIEDVKLLRSHQFPEDSGPLAHPVRPDSYIEINNFYTATVYEKGAELVRMLHTLLGAALFRAGLDLYFERHDGQAVTVEDFLACFEASSGEDLGQFMRWYEQAGTPVVHATGQYDEAARSYEMRLRQSCPPTPGQPGKPPLLMPLRLGLIGPDGADMPLSGHNGDVIRLTQAEAVFRFTGLPHRPVLSLGRGFSAPVRYAIDLPDADRAFLMAHDSDLFNRWQVAQDHALKILTHNSRARETGGETHGADQLIEAMMTTLADAALEPVYRSLFITLPGEGDIAREMAKNVDPGAIHTARESLRTAMAAALRPQLLELYQQLADDSPFVPDAKGAGRRALRNTALALLAAGGGREDLARVAVHGRDSARMTDAIAALGIVTHFDTEIREQAFDGFYRRWRDDHLVMDKWFALQATSSRPDALERVRELMEHPLFCLTKPNRVRAVIHAFAMGNPVNFHRPDGAGYAFVADQVLALDRINAQLAARLATALRNWRILEPGRQALARAALERIAAQGSLSRDVYEIATKSLA
jgi:aminopeptidase N